MLANEVANFTCQFCGGSIPPNLSKSRHEHMCIQNPRWNEKRVDLRAHNSFPRTKTTHETGMRVITINLSSKIVDAIDARVAGHEWASRSEFIRSAVNLLVAQLGGRQ